MRKGSHVIPIITSSYELLANNIKITALYFKIKVSNRSFTELLGKTATTNEDVFYPSF
jgi:hypothetical protein